MDGKEKRFEAQPLGAEVSLELCGPGEESCSGGVKRCSKGKPISTWSFNCSGRRWGSRAREGVKHKSLFHRWLNLRGYYTSVARKKKVRGRHMIFVRR